VPKDVERNGVSMNFPVFVERELKSSQSVGLSQIETESWSVMECSIIISLGISFVSPYVE
jgi:hypothetical protein